ncbi:MAG: hypothetical protein H0X29_07340 [Parachlamydiaceae bacterium]|nr:hypothetical protein [Parachlamydiaceae bacterium]
MVGPAGSGSGTGGSGSLGSPLSPTQREIETTAWTEVNKAALGIVKDSIDMSFSQLDNRYSASHLGTQTGYRAREDQPLLDHTLENVRVLQSLNVPIDASWASTYEQMISQLPPGVLARFLLEQQKPLNERDPSFAATANVLMLTAQILTVIAQKSQPLAPDTLEAARTEKNMHISKTAMNQSVINTIQAANKAEEFLIEQGANLPHHDEYKNTITEIRGAAEFIGNMGPSALSDYTKGETAS